MRTKFFRSTIESDFETFVKFLPSLEPIEFCGLAKILSVKLDKEEKDENGRPIPREIDEVLSETMDKFLALPRHRRKEINKMLKDIRRRV